jgi:hypothetical protein
MRGRKSYNIRNIEAHLNNIRPKEEDVFRPIAEPSFLLNQQLLFNSQKNQNNNYNYLNNETKIMNEYINAKYGVSRYASNQVSGKMFTKI